MIEQLNFLIPPILKRTFKVGSRWFKGRYFFAHGLSGLDVTPTQPLRAIPRAAALERSTIELVVRF